MAQDEGCFGRISRAKRCWAPPRVRPHVPAQIVREYIYAYTAVAPTLGQMVSLILPEASTALMNLLLEEVSRAFSKYFIIMQVDQAGWHNSKDLVIPENKGALGSIPPTGKQVAVSTIEITRMAGGKIVEDWGLDDRLGMLQQLGLVPAMG
jgi:SnoaL-like polyketide cyclase